MLDARDALIDQVAEWRKKPFNPHAIARLRPTAYQKAVFMKYVDNLIEWGDQLFRRDTMESVNEATQLYVLAAQILGQRPRRVEVEPPAPRTFNELLAAGLDEFSNALVEEVEGFLPELTSRAGDTYEDDLPVVGPTLFFCVPPNEKLITDYWDRVADRLFKLRHCMNIEGVVRQLPLFEPPIDPALLVRAAAAGMDLASALSDFNAPLPLHRFQVLAQKATELCVDVRGLGQALLSALEKRDAEELALLRAGHEIKLQTAMVEVRKKQIDDANEALESLKRSKENAEIRLKYYRSRLFMNPKELLHVAMLGSARTWESRAQVADRIGSIVGALPNFDIGICGFGGSPIVKASWGSPQMIQIAKAVADGFRMEASAASHGAQMASIMAGYERRMDDWALQGDVAQKEIAGLERQILGAEVRVAVAEKELDNLKLQIEQSKESEEFLRDKYTNAQLYQWMVGQLSSLYFQSYKLAYDLAKRAERTWQFELAQPDRSFIQFGYWDGLKKGLLAGERLHHDLKRMEVAYLDDHRREYELTRHVSLRKLDPIALLRLRREGECIVRVPEAWFDLDSPGHYMRRIKTVALSIPAVAGPYVPVRCTLTLLRSSTRVSPSAGPGYPRTSVNDPRFRDDVVGQQSIVTSRAEEDSGLFETNLRDERYLPFEGAGADSEWRLELPKGFRQFDYDTITDVVLHIRYTAREGGSALRQASEGELHAALQGVVLGSQASAAAGSGEGLFRVVSARRDFPDAWAQFLTPPDGQTDQAITFDLGSTRFPFAFQDATIKVAGFELIMVVRDTATYATETAVKMSVAAPGGGAAQPVDLQGVATELGGLPHGGHGYGNATKDPGDWVVTFKEADNAGAAPSAVVSVNGHNRLNAAAVEDLLLVLRYMVAP
ncbi:MAG: toxin [Proteobacteria bacterium]|nr:MAG: toxin [Pseudomonadota bacterium]